MMNKIWISFPVVCICVIVLVALCLFGMVPHDDWSIVAAGLVIITAVIFTFAARQQKYAAPKRSLTTPVRSSSNPVWDEVLRQSLVENLARHVPGFRLVPEKLLMPTDVRVKNYATSVDDLRVAELWFAIDSPNGIEEVVSALADFFRNHRGGIIVDEHPPESGARSWVFSVKRQRLTGPVMGKQFPTYRIVTSRTLVDQDYRVIVSRISEAA